MADSLVVEEDGALPLPWLAAPLADVLTRQRGHSLLLHGAAGVGTLPFGLVLAQAWLCEGDATGPRPCGRCGSCRLVQGRLHPDLFVLLPEGARRAHGWLLTSDKPEADDKKKPSKQVRIDEVRLAIDWAQKTSARGRGKVLLIHPAETMNFQAATALLKTLEEPPPGTHIALGVSDPALLLATVRSRCQRVVLPTPPAAVAVPWLEAQGLKGADVLLAAAGGRPLEALALAGAGVDAPAWAALPKAVARGGDIAALNDWAEALRRVARHDEHPWNEGLLLEALVTQGRRALKLPP